MLCVLTYVEYICLQLLQPQYINQGTAVCVVDIDMAWSTKPISQNNSLVASQILIESQFKKLEAGVTNNLLSYHKEAQDHYNYMCANSLPVILSFT